MNRAFQRKHPRMKLRPALANPIAQALMRRDGMANIERIRTDASIFALISDNAGTTLQAAGRILFIALGAAMSIGSTGDEPDLRIIRGAASAAGDIHANAATLEHNRQAIISGLQAVDRLWPALHPRDLIHAYIECEQKLSTLAGLNLSDFNIKIGKLPA